MKFKIYENWMYLGKTSKRLMKLTLFENIKDCN